MTGDLSGTIDASAQLFAGAALSRRERRQLIKTFRIIAECLLITVGEQTLRAFLAEPPDGQKLIIRRVLYLEDVQVPAWWLEQVST